MLSYFLHNVNFHIFRIVIFKVDCFHFKISPSDAAIPENCIILGRSASWVCKYLCVCKDKFDLMTGDHIDH